MESQNEATVILIEATEDAKTEEIEAEPEKNEVVAPIKDAEVEPVTEEIPGKVFRLISLHATISIVFLKMSKLVFLF